MKLPNIQNSFHDLVIQLYKWW